MIEKDLVSKCAVMSKLPAAFPRLQLLEIQGGDADTTYLSTVQNWNTIEKIKDSSNGYLTIRLLQLLTFDHLYCMEVTLSGIGGHYVRHRMTKALIAAIHNAPALEKLTVAVSKVDINDIEDLHARATRLKHLKFYNVYWVMKLQTVKSIFNLSKALHQSL